MCKENLIFFLLCNRELQCIFKSFSKMWMISLTPVQFNNQPERTEIMKGHGLWILMAAKKKMNQDLELLSNMGAW